MSTVQTKQ